MARLGRGGGCVLCGVSGAACGHPSPSVGFEITEEVAVVGGPLRKYRVTMPNGVVTTMKLNDDDAERYGGVPLDAPDARHVGPEQDEPDTAGPPAAKKRASANKSRTARTKAGGGG